MELRDRIRRGRRAIAQARHQGLDTRLWEQRLAELEREALMSWAAEIAEQDMTVSQPISFVEAPQRKITTQRVSAYAARYLKTISYSRLQQQKGGWEGWTVDWWQAQEQEAIDALEALRQAVEARSGESDQ